ncbi:MAG TPA: hypothetical protein VGJ73_14605 [Verrucomicrobiae bacterium]
MSFSRVRNHFTNWREWELNPIVVKELRQAVRSWTVTGMLLLLLTILLVASLLFFGFQAADADPDVQLGTEMFSAFAVILAIASLVFIPLYLGIRVAAERPENNPDLLYVSTLSPARIILGKFLCGAYMAVLFFSACMPFMAFTNLLRGVDLPTVFFILFYLFLTVCGVNMVAIFFGCIPASRPFKVLFAIFGILVSLYMIGRVIAYAFMFMNFGIGTTMGGRDFWSTTLTAVAVEAAVTGLFYVMSVAMVSPPSSNRALPIRVYITVIWLLTVLVEVAWLAKHGRSDTFDAWTVPMFVLLLLSLLVVISNSDTLSNRVRRAIPRAPWKRFFAFLFFNGAAGGLVWIAAMMAATFLVSFRIFSLFPSYVAGSGDELLSLGAFAVYAFAYALTALFIHRTFFRHRPAKIAGLLAVFITAACALTPSIVLFFLNKLTMFSIERLELGNVFNIFVMRDDTRLVYHFYFALGWLAVIAALNVRWFFIQLRNFVPPPKNAPPVIAYGPGNPTSPAGG